MTTFTLALCAPLIGVLVWGAAQDIATRRLPNWLTFGLIISGLAQSFTPWHTVGPMGAFLGLFVGGSLPFIQFAMGALGGGDVKLLAGVGAWLGPVPSLFVFAFAAIVGMIIVLGQCAYQGKLRTLFRNSAVVTINLIHMREVGVDYALETGKASRSVDRPIPYAVPVLFATLAVLAIQFVS